jgi:hypothetical protein
MGITLDVGGEGRHAQALNLNCHRHKTLGSRRGEPIPRLIIARSDRIPLADGSVARVIVERTPLTQAALAEIRRVLAPGGIVILRHVPLPWHDRHATARRMLPGRAWRRRQVIAGQQVQETRIELSG